jgi:AraC family transcriptional activator of tynA and feaB
MPALPARRHRSRSRKSEVAQPPAVGADALMHEHHQHNGRVEAVRRGTLLPKAARLSVPPRDEASAALFPSDRRDSITSRLYTEPAVNGTLEFTRLAGLAFGRVRAGAHRTVYDPRDWPEPLDSQAHVVLQVSGSSGLEYNGHMSQLDPGMFAVTAADTSYAIASYERSERIVVVTERERLGVGPSLSLKEADTRPSGYGLGRVLFSAMTSVVIELYDIRTAHAPALAQLLTELLSLAIKEELTREWREDADERRGHVREFVARHLHDPELNLDRIAAGLHWSRRTLTRLYSGRGESLMEYVYRQRLDGVHRDLLHVCGPEQSLTAIALQWGFSSYSHLYERYRKHFATSPAATRRRAQNDKMDPDSDTRP